MCTQLKLYNKVKNSELSILWFTFETKFFFSAQVCEGNHSQQAETQVGCRAKMDMKIPVFLLICEHSSSCVSLHIPCLQQGLHGAMRAHTVRCCVAMILNIALTLRSLTYAFFPRLPHPFYLDYKLFSKAEMLENQSL